MRFSSYVIVNCVRIKVQITKYKKKVSIGGGHWGGWYGIELLVKH